MNYISIIKRTNGFSFVLFCVLFSFSTSIASNTETIQKQIDKSIEKKLWEHPHWKRLLHYYSSNGNCSDIDGGYFFLAQDGNCNPKSELIATIKALLTSQNTAIDKHKLAKDLHPLIKYRARLHFLQDHGLLPEQILPNIDQSRYFRWRDALDPVGIRIVFATGYFGNPASIMGHTFLRLESKGNTGARETLNYAITFSADKGDDIGIVYGLKGIFGQYPGNYNIVQYHIHMQTYLNNEARDLWEYPIELTPNELQYLIEHIWEMGLSWQNYYFFSENCSYGLLTLLEATGTRFDFSEYKSGTLLPVESLKAILNANAQSSSIHYRPSITKKFYKRASSLSFEEKEFLEQIIDPNNIDLKNKLPPERQAAVVDAALDLYQHQIRKEKREDDSKEWRNAHLKLLKFRRKLPIGDFGNAKVSTPLETPEQVHLPYKSVLNTSYHHKSLHHGLSLRYSYHDFLQNAISLNRATELQLLDVGIRWSPDYPIAEAQTKTNLPELNHITLAKVGSINPITRWENPLSWHGELSIKRRHYDDRFLSAYFDVNVGWGIGSNFTKSQTAYFLPGVRNWTSHSFQFATGPGVKTGYFKEFSPSVTFAFQSSIWYTFFHKESVEYDAIASLRWSPTLNTEIIPSWTYSHEYQKVQLQLGLSF